MSAPEPLQTFVLLATDGEYQHLTHAEWAEWIDMVDDVAQGSYSLKAVTYSPPTDAIMTYVAIGLATATQLQRMRKTLREIRDGLRTGEVSITVVADGLDETI